MAKLNLQAFVDNAVIEELERLSAENERLYNEIGNVEALRVENERMMATMRQIAQAVEPEADQLQNWIAGQVNAALSEPPAKPDVNAAVVG